MEITVHTDTPIVYTDNEIFEFEEKKTAHPIGAELPTIEVSFKVDNIAGDYNADSPSGLYEQLIKGVKVTYRYGLEIPDIMPYGYPADVGETEEPIYGADPLNPYGFSPSSTIEWMDGGEVYTTGEISYDKTSATIEAVDALSFLEETADVAYGTINRKQCAEFIINATEYPEDALGAKKISIDNVLETWNTNIVSDKNAKQVLQSLAHASGVQMYIDRSGYLHLDKAPITTGTVDYHVTLGDQDEEGEFTKGKTPRKVTIKINTNNVVPEVSETINAKGEDVLVENDFVQTTLQAEALLPWVKRYLGMRNTAEIEYAGDPALDILDIILLDTEYSENIPATIVESTIRFDGSITGSLVLRYDSALADNTTVKITGAENFIYSGETPNPASVTLVCETDMTSPSYEWSYFNGSSSGWQIISGATTANLTILADSPYIVGSNPTSFRVVVTGDEGTKGNTVRIQRVQETVQQGHTYLGKLSALPSAYDVGDYFLVSTAFSEYGLGDVVQWDGDSWEVTTNPTLIVAVYQDALTLSLPLENTSAVNQYIRSIQTKQILLSTDTPIMFFYEDDTPYDGGQVATITATRRNVIAGINWYINGNLVPDYDEDTIMVYDTDMSDNEITVTAVSVEYANVNAVIKIAKKKDRKLDASNLGLITNGDPTPTVGKDGAPLVAGDYFMWGNPTTSTPDERKKGAVYIYQTDGTWLEDTEGTKTMSMFAQFADIANDVESSVMGNAIIKNLVAIKAFIEELGTKEIAVKEDGSVGSEDFAEDEAGIPTSGYKLDNPLTPSGRRGRVRAHGGIFNNTTIYGSIIHDALVTRKSAPTTPVTFPSKTAWNRKDFWNALSVTENSADMIATDLNVAGTAYSYLRKITSATFEKQIISYQEYPAVDFDVSEYYTSPAKGSVRINCYGTDGSYTYPSYDLVWVPYYYPDPRAPGQFENQLVQKTAYASADVMIYINGVHVATSSANTQKEFIFSITKGSTIRIRRLYSPDVGFVGNLYTRYGIDWRGIQNSLQVSNETTSWDTIEDMASDYLVRGRWQCSNPITFDSNTVLTHALANAFIAGFSDLPEGMEIETDSATSAVTYGALTDQPINSVINYGSSIRLNYTGGYITFVAGSNADGSFTGWYNATASVSVLSKEGIVTSNIIPKDATREIGEFDNPYKKGFFEQVATGLVDADAVNTGGITAGDGCIEISAPTPYIDFHFDRSASDYTSRIIESASGLLTIPASLSVGNALYYKPTTQFESDTLSSGYISKTISAMAVGEHKLFKWKHRNTASYSNTAAIVFPSGGNYLITFRYFTSRTDVPPTIVPGTPYTQRGPFVDVIAGGASVSVQVDDKESNNRIFFYVDLWRLS
jgi:hypothetical protein